MNKNVTREGQDAYWASYPKRAHIVNDPSFVLDHFILLAHLDDYARNRLYALLELYYQSGAKAIPLNIDIMLKCFTTLTRISTEVEEQPYNPKDKRKGFIHIPWKENNALKICINPWRHNHVFDKRLTIMHEIGHILFGYYTDNGRIKHRYGVNSQLEARLEEMACDEIMMYCVCPPAEIKKLLQDKTY